MTVHPEIERIARGVKALHEMWTPHPAQIEIGRALIGEHVKDVFAQCGRNLGKSELTAYLMWRWAWTYPGSENYYFSPFMKQSREIMWASRRMQTLGPEDWIEKINDQEMRITFKNGSWLKLDGSDNVEAYRGVKPRGLTVFDEFKDFRPEFFDAYDPNRAAHDTPLFIIGTPPEFEGQFTELAESWKKDPTKRFFQFPTHENPHISRKWLADKKAELYARGEGDKWEREYLAQFVRGGSKRIFPMLKESMIIPHAQLLQSIEKDKRRLEWFVVADPAGASTFAVLFAAINPYTRQVYLLNEIYEQRQEEMTVRRIGERISAMTRQLFKGEWRYIYDEAEAWFANEMLEHFDLPFEPTQKARNDKTTGLSLIKDVMLAGKLSISSECKKWFWEADNYRKDDEGRIIKKNDHCIAFDEPVETNQGLKQISQVRAGDKVLTRSGYRRVLRAWQTDVRQTIILHFSDNKTLRCTPEHKIYTKNRGFVRADRLRYGDEIVTTEQCKAKKLSLMALYTDAILKAILRTSEAITDAVRSTIRKLELDTFTELFGLSIKGQSQRVIRSIILMAILIITKLKTLSVFLGRRTEESTKTNMFSSEGQRKGFCFLRRLGQWLLDGISLSQESNGISSTQSMSGVSKTGLKSKLLAAIAQDLTKQTTSSQVSIAQTNASQPHDGKQEKTTLQQSANAVASHSQKTNTQNRKPAAESAVIFSHATVGEIIPVWDLMVSGAHEFLAADRLVHNCLDCTRYLLGAAHYGLIESTEFIREADPMWRGSRIEDDFPGFSETGEKIDEWGESSW